MSKHTTAITRGMAVGLILLIIAFSVLRFSGCSSDSPVASRSSDSYMVYLTGFQDTSLLFGIRPGDTTIKTWTVPWVSEEAVAISADGNLLYHGNESVTVRETDSFMVMAELPYSADNGIAVSPDNSKIAFFGDDLYILNTADYSVVFHDTLELEGGVFSHDSKTLYGYGATGDFVDLVSFVYKLTLSSEPPSVALHDLDYARVRGFLPSQDQSLWFFFGTDAFRANTDFVVWDISGDSTVFLDSLGYIGDKCDLELNPDGTFLFYSYPCPSISHGMACTEPGKLKTFDVAGLVSGSDIDCVPEEVLDPYITEASNIGPICMTPDGAYIVGVSFDHVIIVDAVQKEMVDHMWLAEETIAFVQTFCQTMH